MRDQVLASIDKWSDAIGSENVINQLAKLLVVENPELRTEGLKWILSHEQAIPEADKVEMVKPLIACLTDKSKMIRDQAEKIIMILMPLIGYQEFLSAIKDFKTAM